MKISELEKGKDFKKPSKYLGCEQYFTIALKQFREDTVSVYSHFTGNTIQLPADYNVEPVNKIPREYLDSCKKRKKDVL